MVLALLVESQVIPEIPIKNLEASTPRYTNGRPNSYKAKNGLRFLILISLSSLPYTSAYVP
jgi:hypothetical protein